MKICTFDGCERPSKARSLCPGHYRQLQRKGELVALKEPTKVIRFEPVGPLSDGLQHPAGWGDAPFRALKYALEADR